MLVDAGGGEWVLLTESVESGEQEEVVVVVVV